MAKNVPEQFRLQLNLLPTQIKFIQSNAKFPAYIGGYGAGKSYIMCIWQMLRAMENPGLPGLLLAPTYRDLRDTLEGLFKNILTDYEIPFTWRASDNILKLTWWDSEVWFRSADEPDKLKGPNVAWAGIDEATRISRDIWPIIVSRVRHPRSKTWQTAIDGTPEGLNWVYEHWVENATRDYELFTASTLENVHLDPSYAEALRSTHDEQELKQKLGGQFVCISTGRVYKSFDRTKHVQETSPFDPEDAHAIVKFLPIALCCDFNRNPCVWEIAQMHQGAVYVADEILLEDTTVDAMIDEVQRRGYHKHPSGIVVYGDPAGRALTVRTAKSDYQIMAMRGLSRQVVATSHPPVKDRTAAVDRLLRNDMMFINPRCKALIRDFERVSWLQDDSSALDKRDSKLTHASDGLGYFIFKESPLILPQRTPTLLIKSLSRRLR